MPPSNPNSLSQEDIERLLHHRSVQTDMEVVQKLSAQYGSEGEEQFTRDQTAIANDIFQLIMARAQTQVRAVLASNLSHTNKLPGNIARMMVNDVSEVANPILENSSVLSDEDLLNIIKSADDSEKLQAIARRKKVSETVSDALVETHIEPVVGTLVGNEGAAISEKTFEKIVEHHSDSAHVVERVFQRNAVPVAVVEKVITRLSDNMRAQLENKYGNLHEFKEMKKALDQSLEITSLRMLGYQSSDQELMKLLNYLDSNNKLSPFSALSMGNLQLFAVSMSRLLRVPLKNIEKLLEAPNGLKAAYDQAELPESLFEAVALAVRAIAELEQESIKKTGFKEQCTPFQVMNRMMELAQGRQIQGTDYLYAMIRQCGRNNIMQATAGTA